MLEQDVEEDDIITVSCSGVVQYFRVIEPKTLLCEMFSSETSERFSCYNLEKDKFGVDETRTSLIKNWGKYTPSRQEVVDMQGREVRKLCNHKV